MSRVMLVGRTHLEGANLCLPNQHNVLFSKNLDFFGIKPDCQLYVIHAEQDLFHMKATVFDRIKKVYQEIQLIYCSQYIAQKRVKINKILLVNQEEKFFISHEEQHLL